jgi:hypothetical protein
MAEVGGKLPSGVIGWLASLPENEFAPHRPRKAGRAARSSSAGLRLTPSCSSDAWTPYPTKLVPMTLAKSRYQTEAVSEQRGGIMATDLEEKAVAI